MGAIQVEIPKEFLDIPQGQGRILGICNGKFYGHGNSLPITQRNGSGLVLDNYIVGAINGYGVNNVFALYRLKEGEEVMVANIHEDNFSFLKLVKQRGKEGLS